MTHSIQLDLIQKLHEFRTPLLDGLFKFMNYFDRQEFIFALIPALWVTKGWKTGLRIAYILFLSTLFNSVAKNFFALPRPFHLDPLLGVIQVGGYGFPSGAAQTVILLSGILVKEWKSRWRWPVAFVYIFLVSLSRVYLGVHFFTDILGGWAIGYVLWLIYTYIFPLIENRVSHMSVKDLTILGLIIPICLFFSHPSFKTLLFTGAAVGTTFGIRLCMKHRIHLPEARNLSVIISRCLVAVIGTFLTYLLLEMLPISPSFAVLFIRFMIVGLFVSFGAVWICYKILYNPFHLRK